ncbi:RNA-binding protein 26-like [Pomacea canaliculata]|uniref:RNA-binding protein 26-like n=1 Tax=Pomacea canaliculata TaxID=400727 RepID=UPI000D7366E3|nr:RNA-binding protein 26-like [Pomacea canaliculata]
MLIENVDALKQWLVQKLSPICDAEPTALAKYVCALVRKDKPETELRDICNDQLDVFLQQKTKPFVDDLFEGLRTKVYEAHIAKSAAPNLSTTSTPLATPAVTPSVTPTKVEPVPVKNEPLPARADALSPIRNASQPVSASSSQSKATNSDSNSSVGRRGKRIEDGSQLWLPQTVKMEPAVENKDHRGENRDARENREREVGREDRERRDSDRRDMDRYEADKRENDRRDNDRRDLRDSRDRRRRSRSRSSSPRRGREMEERRRRYDDRSRYSPERRYSPDRRYRRRSSRSRSPRRYRISPDRVRGRSRSPRERDLREKLNRHSRSWSRPRSRSRSLSRPRIGMDPDSRGSTPTQDNGHYPAVVTSNSSLPSMIAVPLKPSEPPPPGEGPPLLIPRPGGPPGAGQARMRCQNFDEKGFCMLGDLCPYDHGMDPVVVEDIGIPNVLPFPPVPPGHPLPPPPVSVAINVPPPRLGYLPPRMHLPPPGPGGDPRMMAVRPNLPPRPPLPQVPDPAEGYNPEAPAMTGPPPAPQPFWTSPPPGLFPPTTKNTPPPLPVRQRDLVAVPTLLDEAEDAAKERNSPTPAASRIVIPAKRTHSEMEDATTRIVQRTHFNPRHSFGHVGGKKPFDFNRLGGFNRQQFKHENLTLEVRKIPVEFNNIAKLNEHFGKFGTLTNIQVSYNNDPSAALISFSKNEEASRAYFSSEPVFNNRFIKLFWHRPSAGDAKDMSASGGGGGVIRLSSSEAVTSTSQDGGARLNMFGRMGMPGAHKMSLNNMAKSAQHNMSEKSIVYTTSMGNLKKTVFNQQVNRARSAVAPITSPTAVKTADFVTRIEAIKKNEELKKEAMEKKAELEKQKQILLEKHIADQKTLIEKLEKGKTTLLPEEKSNIMKQMLKVVSDSIDKLKFGNQPTKKVLHPGSHKLVKTSSTSPMSPSPPSSNLQQTKKEILDTELELITKQSSGEDTSALRLRLMELTQQQQSDPLSFQAASMGLLGKGRGRGRGSSPWMRGRGRGRGRTGSMTLDNRPKTLEVRGFDLEEVEEVKAHFSSFGEIVQSKVKEDIPCAILTFFTRKQAEQAYSMGSKFKKKVLNLHWHLGVVRTVSSESIEEPNDDEEEEEFCLQTQVTISKEEDIDEQLLLAPDEEEEEDQESRSWRR